jgi:hypothetical protein
MADKPLERPSWVEQKSAADDTPREPLSTALPPAVDDTPPAQPAFSAPARIAGDKRPALRRGVRVPAGPAYGEHSCASCDQVYLPVKYVLIPISSSRLIIALRIDNLIFEESIITAGTTHE